MAGYQTMKHWHTFSNKCCITNPFTVSSLLNSKTSNNVHTHTWSLHKLRESLDSIEHVIYILYSNTFLYEDLYNIEQ